MLEECYAKEGSPGDLLYSVVFVLNDMVLCTSKYVKKDFMFLPQKQNKHSLKNEENMQGDEYI